MKKKYLLGVVLLLLFNIFGSFAVFAKEQPAVCGWPSKEMAQYFAFQNEMISALFNSDAQEKLLTIWNTNWWLFSEWTLELPSTAMDLVAGSVLWNVSSIISSAMTSYVLIRLATISTVWSSVNTLAILFKDRPIVRDYREMMNIETNLFDTAFFRSKQMNLTRPMEDWQLQKELNSIIKKYRENGLLEKSNNQIKASSSIADILSDLILMNAAMKHFIVYGWAFWTEALKWYYGCFQWNWSKDTCIRDVAILKFNEDAINQLRKDYSWIRVFWSCNQYKSNIRSTISKWIDNSKTSIKAAMDDVKNASVRLRNTTIWWIGNDRRRLLTDPCNMTEYEMAQLRAYRWSDWECWKWVGVSSIVNTVKDFPKIKEAIAKHVEGVITQIKESAKEIAKNYKKEISNAKTTAEKSQKWKDIFWTWVTYNPEFSEKMYEEYQDIYKSTMNEFLLSQLNATASDLSEELSRIKWLVDQLDSASDAIWQESWKWLRKTLLDIANYQCTN